MPTVFHERHLQFTFNDDWSVIQYDQHRDYRERIAKLQGSDAVDFVGTNRDSFLYLIEATDFRAYRIENQNKVTGGGLATEVALKVRDTIAGIVGAHHRGNEEEWGHVVRKLRAGEPPVHVVLWMEEDLPPGPRGRRPNEASVLTNALKKRLDWLTPRVLVVSSRIGTPPEGLIVENLPGAGLSNS